MSGGNSSSIDPYHEKSPPKREPKRELDPSELPTQPIGPVKEITLPKKMKKAVRGWGYCRVIWYRCDNCGEIFSTGRWGKLQNPHGFCPGGECQKEWWSKYSAGKPKSDEHRKKIAEAHRGKSHSEETKRKLSDVRKELFSNPEFMEKMREAANRPEVREKHAAAMRGPRNPNWKGGPSERKRIPTPADEYRYTVHWRNKSEEIRERDNHICTGCGRKSEDDTELDVHHIYPLNDWIDDGYDPKEYPDSWLMTLDKSCHTRADAQPGVFKRPPKKE